MMFVAQDILDHGTADERRVVHEKAQHLGRFAAARRADKAVDKRSIDLGPETGRGDQGQGRDALRPPRCHECRDRSAHRMSDQVNPLHVQRFQRALDGIGQVFRVARTDVLGRSAMPRQVQRNSAPSCRQSGLGEHPGIDIGAKAMHQQHRGPVTLAEIEIAQAPAGDLDVPGLYPFGLRFLAGRGFDDCEPGDERVDLGFRHLVGSHDGEQRADRQGRTSLRHDPPQGTRGRRFDNVGDLRGLDLQDLLALGKALALLLEPAHDRTLSHGQAPFRHRDRGDGGTHSA